MRYILTLMTVLLLSQIAFATPYAVNADVVNVRSGADTNSIVVGTLERGETVDVKGDIENGWATIDYNGQQAYVNAQYLKQRGWFGRVIHFIFSSDGQPSWLVVVKWILIVGLIFVLFRYLLAILVKMLAGGMAGGVVGLVFGFIVHWIGWLESTSTYMMASYGFYIGAAVGLILALINYRSTIDDANSYQFGKSGASNVDADGLKHYRVVDDYGHAHHLTQCYKYSETDYKDEDGHEWIHDNSGFRRV